MCIRDSINAEYMGNSNGQPPPLEFFAPTSIPDVSRPIERPPERQFEQRRTRKNKEWMNPSVPLFDTPAQPPPPIAFPIAIIEPIQREIVKESVQAEDSVQIEQPKEAENPPEDKLPAEIPKTSPRPTVSPIKTPPPAQPEPHEELNLANFPTKD
eukprot:TRINITY_DN8260_c0_g1_i2.p1 TRINITY_DN8260_c0_g1~~TRINITY_DN8260_c0_g1_i2.p1  ORF type:complete len:175 (+),score=58.20 TRINITY_DN8260_c0_g1_i2:62-526(+)